MIRRALTVAMTLWTVSSVAAHANHFDAFSQIKMGAKLVVYSSEIVLLLMVSGLWIALDTGRGALFGFGVFFAGVFLGFAGVFLWPIQLTWFGLALSFLFGASVALNYHPRGWIIQSGVFVAGAACAPMAFVDRYVGQNTPLVLGNFVLTLLILLSVSYLICVSLRMQSIRHWWLSVVLRVLGSWTVAASTMILALNLTHQH